MTLFCFDVDGTLLSKEMENEGQYVKGIIPTELLIELEKYGHTITVVSPSPYLPERYTDDKHWFKEYGSNEYRWKNVQDAMVAHDFKESQTIYVDDLEANRNQLHDQGIFAISPEEFMKLYSSGHEEYQ